MCGYIKGLSDCKDISKICLNAQICLRFVTKISKVCLNVQLRLRFVGMLPHKTRLLSEGNCSDTWHSLASSPGISHTRSLSLQYTLDT